MRKTIIFTLVTISLLMSQPVSALPGFTLTTSDNQELSFQQFEGEPFLTIAMTSECSSCKLQHDYMKKIARVNPNLTIISVAIDTEIDSVDTIKEYKEQQSLPWTVVLDTNQEFKIFYRIINYPQTFLFDATGEVVKKWFGVVTTDDLTAEIGEYYDITEPDNTDPLLESLLSNRFFLIWVGVMVVFTSFFLLMRLKKSDLDENQQ